MATRASNSKWERKKTAFQASAWAGAISFFVLLALWLNAAPATTVTVLVGNGGFNFSPSSVTIHPGDTVRWEFTPAATVPRLVIQECRTASGILDFVTRERFSPAHLTTWERSLTSVLLMANVVQ